MTDLTTHTKACFIHISCVVWRTAKIFHSIVEIRIEFDHVLHIMRVFSSAVNDLSFFKKNWELRFMNRSVQFLFTRERSSSQSSWALYNRKLVVSRMIDSLAEISMLSRNLIYFLSANSWWSNNLILMTRLNLDRSILRRFWKRRESRSNSRAHAAADFYEFLK
jgi:hypothetical protein